MPCFPLILGLIAPLSFVPVIHAQMADAPPGAAGSSTEAVAGPGPPEIVNRVAPSVVQVLRAQTGAFEDSIGDGRGSGIAVAEGVISSDHVVGDADQVVVIASDGRRGSATVVRRAPARDLVLLETNLALPPVDVEAASDQHAGELVLVLGYPWPDTLGDAALTVTHGLVSAVRHDQEGLTYLQTDAAMDPGVSGGAVVNMRGHVVGVPSFGLRGDAGSSLNFAVGGEEIRAVLQPQPPPTPAGLVYAGDPHDLLPSNVDIGPGWRVVPTTPETSSGITPTESDDRIRAARQRGHGYANWAVRRASARCYARSRCAACPMGMGARGSPSASRIRAFTRPDAGLDLPRLPADRRRCHGPASLVPGGQCCWVCSERPCSQRSTIRWCAYDAIGTSRSRPGTLRLLSLTLWERVQPLAKTYSSIQPLHGRRAYCRRPRLLDWHARVAQQVRHHAAAYKKRLTGTVLRR
jgi:hypothetical protein